jgi:hypothetical protein
MHRPGLETGFPVHAVNAAPDKQKPPEVRALQAVFAI